jgi:chromodomain-helicase-DNA-binding protein 7
MFDKASLKLGLDKAVLQSMNTVQGTKETQGKQLTKKEIEDLLKKGKLFSAFSYCTKTINVSILL